MNTSTPTNYHLIEQGTHIIIDLYEIENNDNLKYINSIIEILDKIVNEFNLNVVNKALHQFEPFGVTGVYVLSESHLSIHTFVEEKKVALDLYTCKTFKDTEKIIEFIQNLFGNCKCSFKIIER